MSNAASLLLLIARSETKLLCEFPLLQWDHLGRFNSKHLIHQMCYSSLSISWITQHHNKIDHLVMSKAAVRKMYLLLKSSKHVLTFEAVGDQSYLFPPSQASREQIVKRPECCQLNRRDFSLVLCTGPCKNPYPVQRSRDCCTENRL